MKQFLYNNFICLLFSVGFIACTKNSDVFTPYTNAELNDVSWSSESISEVKSQAIINLLRKPIFTNSFNAVYGLTATINNQTQIELPSNIYLLNNTNYNGAINSRVTKINNKGDFIRNLIPSCNATNYVEFNKLIQLQLADNLENNISLKPNNNYQIKFVDSSTTIDYSYFIGTKTTANEGSIVWSKADSANSGYLQNSLILINGVYYNGFEIVSKNFNWHSICKPISFSNLLNCNIKIMVNNFTNKNTVVFAVFNDYNIVLRLQSNYNSKLYSGKNFPLGANIKLVSLTNIDGLFYLGTQDIIVNANTEYSIKPSINAISLQNLNSFLDGL